MKKNLIALLCGLLGALVVLFIWHYLSLASIVAQHEANFHELARVMRTQQAQSEESQ